MAQGRVKKREILDRIDKTHAQFERNVADFIHQSQTTANVINKAVLDFGARLNTFPEQLSDTLGKAKDKAKAQDKETFPSQSDFLSLNIGVFAGAIVPSTLIAGFAFSALANMPTYPDTNARLRVALFLAVNLALTAILLCTFSLFQIVLQWTDFFTLDPAKPKGLTVQGVDKVIRTYRLPLILSLLSELLSVIIFLWSCAELLAVTGKSRNRAIFGPLVILAIPCATFIYIVVKLVKKPSPIFP